MRFATLFLTLLALAPAPAGPVPPTIQRASSISASISGTVIADDTAAPARQARVDLIQRGRTTTTDEFGHFSFDGLSAGGYLLSAFKGGYLSASYGQRRPGSITLGTTIDLKDGQQLGGITIHLSRGAAISGTITDDHGEPVYQAFVGALRAVVESGVRVLKETRSTLTDDRGVYRIGLLPVGEYLIRVAPGPEVQARMMGDNITEMLMPPGITLAAMRPGSLPVYYPGTSTPDEAKSVAARAPEEYPGVDVTLRVVPAPSVSGVIVTATGQRVTRARLFLVNRGASMTGTAQGWPVKDDGSFELPRVAPGRYTLIARAAIAQAGADAARELAGGVLNGGRFADSSAELLSAELELTIATANVSDLTLTLRRGVTVAGAVTAGGAGPPPDLSGLIIGLTQRGFSGQGIEMVSVASVAVDESGRFRIEGVPPGQYDWTVSGVPAGWWARSLMVSGRDALDGPMDIASGGDLTGIVLTLQDRSAEIAGTLQDNAGRPTSDYTAVLFPMEAGYLVPGSRRIRAMQTSTDGRFSFRNLPPGAYGLAAVTDVETGAWFDPAFLRSLAGGAVRVTIGDGEQKTQNLKIVK